MKAARPRPLPRWSAEDWERFVASRSMIAERLSAAHALMVDAALEDQESLHATDPEIASSSDGLPLSVGVAWVRRYAMLVINAGRREPASALRTLISHLQAFLDGATLVADQVVATINQLAGEVAHPDLWAQATPPSVAVRGGMEDQPTPHEVRILLRKLKEAAGDD